MARQGPDGNSVKRVSPDRLVTNDTASRWAIPALTGDAEALTWNDAPVGVLVDLIAQVTGSGAAISFAKLRNANGVSVLILDGGARIHHYARSVDELDKLLRRLLAVA